MKELDIDIKKVLDEDLAFKQGADEYERLLEQAQRISEEITSALVTEVVRKTEEEENSLNLSCAILAVARTLTNLVTYFYNDEEEFLQTVEKARLAVVDAIVPTLLSPKACGECPACKSNQVCINPIVNEELLQTRTIPLISASLIEYDLWIKTLHFAEQEAKKQEAEK